MAPEAVRILVDVQEARSGIPAHLEELGAEVELAALPAGDYALGVDTIVERKRVLDLHSAVRKGHLWPQLAKLRAACAFPYLLVEGTDLDRGGLHPNAVRGVCLAAIDQGIALPCGRTTNGTPRAGSIGSLCAASARSCRRIGRCTCSVSPPPPESVAEAMLAAVPGISTVGARALLERFGSLAGVLAAPEEDWLAVPGIGRERASALARAFGTELPGDSLQDQVAVRASPRW
jgi:ERCC4-type nuclease